MATVAIPNDAYGRPVAGSAQNLAYDNTGKSVALTGPAIYILVSTTDVFLGAADASTAANQAIYLPAYTPWAMVVAATFTLYATRVSANGTLYVGQVQH